MDDVQTSNIPVIDIALLLAGGADGMREVSQRIGRACRDIGFFYVTGHGVAPTMLADVFAAAAGPMRSWRRVLAREASDADGWKTCRSFAPV